ncbi:MAG: hypothetical protein K2M76_07650, partial [Muribaculaceae bacterium]|nr:hypothetical protein [Muribaculaceae bacterium]
MADDYIGRKMEELRQGKLGAKQAVPRRGVMQVAFPPKRVMVMRSTGKWADAIVTAFRTVGCLVEVPDVTDVDYLWQKWGGADVVVCAGSDLAETMMHVGCDDVA